MPKLAAHAKQVQVGVSEITGILLGVLITRESYYSGDCIGVPYLRKPPNLVVSKFLECLKVWRWVE